MHVYITLYTPTPPTSSLHPLPSPYYVRVFLSEFRITGEQYRTYLGFLGKSHHGSRIECAGSVPATFSRDSLLPQDAMAITFDGVDYDFTLESEEEVLEYMKFVRTMAALESQRPVFKPRKEQTTQSITPTPLVFYVNIHQTGQEWKDEYMTSIPSEECVLLFEYTEQSNEMFTQWKLIQQHFGSKLRYFIRNTEAAPKIMIRWRSCWKVLNPTIPNIYAELRPHSTIIHQLNTGHLVHEVENGSWEILLGTQVFPNVSIASTLTLYRTWLTWKRPNQVLETWLREEERAILLELMNPEKKLMFSLEHAYGLFAANRHSKLTLPHIAPLCLSSLPNTTTVDTVQPVDKKEAKWDIIKPIQQPDSSVYKKELKELLLEFEQTKDGPLAPPEIQQYAFLLHLLQLSKDRSRDIDPVIKLFRQTKMDLQGTEVSLHQVQSLLTPNTAFLEGEDVLEARVFLELFQSPLELRLPDQKTKLFQMLIQAYSAHCLRPMEGKRTPASQIWDGFLTFLRGKKLDYVGFFGSQMEFNEVMRELGWEQKRISTGKVWVNVEITQ
jgi:hypothetical protein